MTESAWNFGDIFDAVADAIIDIGEGERPALIQDDREISWSQFKSRTNQLARSLIARGAQPNDKVAFYLANAPEYLELNVACFKARLVHVNVNFRYLEDELHYIVDNSDAKFIFYSAQFAERIASVKSRCDKVTHFVEVDETGNEKNLVNAFAENYEALVSGDDSKLNIKRSPDDLVFIYTGGTTGMPKGVMWPQKELWAALGGGKSHPCTKGKIPKDVSELADYVANFPHTISQMPACPLMHATGLFSAFTTLSGGGTIVTMNSTGLDAGLIWQTCQDKRLKSLVIVGDAFAKPMLNALEENPDRWDLGSLRMMISSGVMWSKSVKQGLMEHLPKLICVDSFGSSEAIGFGNSISTLEEGVQTARFEIGDNCKVFTEDHRELVPGSDEKGFIARRGPLPIGYYKDEEKSKKTFPVINGVRYSIPGDWCTVTEQGEIVLLGRGSACINTAGEKVYPEEVEEALKGHADIDDALVFGLPDDKWGMAVTAVIKSKNNCELEQDEVHGYVKQALAAYKAPKRYVFAEQYFRAPNGKADYKAAKAYAEQNT